MAIKIDKATVENNNLTMESISLLFYLYYKNTSIEDLHDKLEKLGLVAKNYTKDNKILYLITQEGINTLEKVILESDHSKSDLTDIDVIAEEILKLFPDGKKEGTNLYWRCGKAELSKRLQIFFKRYTDIDYNLVIPATERYINSFKNTGNFKLMRIAKYFVWKDDRTTGEQQSELLTYIENLETPEEKINQDWTTQLK